MGTGRRYFPSFATGTGSKSLKETNTGAPNMTEQAKVGPVTAQASGTTQASQKED